MAHTPVRHEFGSDALQVVAASTPHASHLLEQAASLVSIGAWSCDLRSDELTWTRGVFDIFGLAADEAPDRREVVRTYDEESRDLLERKRARAIATRTGFTLDARILRPSGSARWVRVTAGTQVASGRAETLYGMKQDITEDRVRWERLRARAECDPLTGVANRSPFQRYLDSGTVIGTPEPVGGLLLFDVDGFKQVNDVWGHAAGDACLAIFAERLKLAFPRASLIARIGGDEFAVLLRAMGPPAGAEAAVRSIVANLLAPVPWNGDLLPLSVSAGLACSHPELRPDPESLFVDADRALYDAKADPLIRLVCA